MSLRIMLIPVGAGVGLTSVSLGMVRAMEQQGLNVNFYKPIAQPLCSAGKGSADVDIECSTQIIENSSAIKPPKPLDLNYAEQLFSEGNVDVLLEQIVGRFEAEIDDDQVVVIEGLVPTHDQAYTGRLNKKIATALGADIVLVAAPGTDTTEHLEDKITLTAANYGGVDSDKVLGIIFNKINAPVNVNGQAKIDLLPQVDDSNLDDQIEQLASLSLFRKSQLKILANISWSEDLIAPRVKDLAEYLNAKVINEGDLNHRRLRSINFCARSVSNMLAHFNPNTLIVTPGDRSDVVVGVCLSVMNGTKIGAILLTGGYELDSGIMNLCRQACESGLPILLTEEDTWRTAQLLQNFNLEVPTDDLQRIDKVKQHTADCIDTVWLQSLTARITAPLQLSPPAFRYLLTERARKANKTVVLPEGNEPRTIKAAAICGERKIARTVLLGNRDEILRIAEHQGVVLNDYVRIVDPTTAIPSFVDPLVELRKHKGMTDVLATQQLEDLVVLGTMMLAQGEVDGLVSGAVNTTANTIRPPLQIIKTAPDSSLVSSIFFMLLPEQVLVYGDCAINPDPNAEQLADIAIQSADSAAAFGIEPRVAMISYSTGSSGAGEDVEKVRKATEIAKSKRPDLLIDGPLQYDAAVMENVAKSKAPDSPVAGKATVFIFPDLNTGNTTYKAVQRSADLVSIGPMLQGMGKPVNDLSRGALVEDIVYTIALTAIQATQ